VVYRIPVLETVVEQNVGPRIVPEAPDGSYTILGRALRFRVQGDSNLRVQINHGNLPRRSQATASSGWYEPAGAVLKSGSRNFFWDIAVELPDQILLPGVKNFQVTFDYDTVTTTATPHPSLTVIARLQGNDAAYVAAMPRPSDVFVDNTENTKGDNRMAISLVTRGVTLAGWLSGPKREDVGFAGTTGSEDWHYTIFLDPDFIERNYGGSLLIEPLKSAALPGHVVPFIRGTAPLIPLLSHDAAAATSKPTAAAFTLPGLANFEVELNAWHTWSAARGPKPTGWVSDPEIFRYSGNAWPFDPRMRNCFDDRYLGHGGYLELHPVDAVRRVDAPRPRKHVVGMAACHPPQPNIDARLSHPDPPPGDNFILRYEMLVDDRFTSANAVHAEQVDYSCPVPALHVTANLPGSGSFHGVYSLWWEQSSTPRPSPTAICIPGVSPILGPVSP